MIQQDIKKGDRIYASLTLNGKMIAELRSESISDTRSLFAELRRQTLRLRGLAKLTVRNISRGWATEKALMLSPAANYQDSGFSKALYR